MDLFAKNVLWGIYAAAIIYDVYGVSSMLYDAAVSRLTASVQQQLAAQVYSYNENLRPEVAKRVETALKDIYENHYSGKLTPEAAETVKKYAYDMLYNSYSGQLQPEVAREVRTQLRDIFENGYDGRLQPQAAEAFRRYVNDTLFSSSDHIRLRPEYELLLRLEIQRVQQNSPRIGP